MSGAPKDYVMRNLRSDVSRGNLGTWIYGEIRDRIISWDIKAGALLSEARIAAEYSVSRTPVREALSHLAKDGMVKAIPRVGYSVLGISLSDIHEIFDLRATLESEAARLAAESKMKEPVERLRADCDEWMAVLHQSQEDAGLYDASTYLRLHDAFHLTIAELSSRRRLVRYITQLLHESTRIRMADPLMRSDGLVVEEVFRREMLQLLLAGKQRKAGDLMKRHILESKERSLDWLLGGN